MEDRQITIFADPAAPVECTYYVCPKCGRCGTSPRHDDGCSKPKTDKKYVNTTQFGPMNYGEWTRRLSAKINKNPKRKTEVKKNEIGEVAIFDCLRGW